MHRLLVSSIGRARLLPAPALPAAVALNDACREGARAQANRRGNLLACEHGDIAVRGAWDRPCVTVIDASAHRGETAAQSNLGDGGAVPFRDLVRGALSDHQDTLERCATANGAAEHPVAALDQADQLGTFVVTTNAGLGDRLDAGFTDGMDAADAASCMGGLEATRWFARAVGSGHRGLRVRVGA